MGWKGIAFGAWIGSVFGGPLGAILGAAIGGGVEGHLKNRVIGGRSQKRRTTGAYGARSQRDRELVFCASAAAMLAKMAKADGRVTKTEIASVEAAFTQLGFTKAIRSYAVEVFRKAKDDGHTIYEYAMEFAAVVNGVEAREVFYGLLWDLACADGVVSHEELEILRHIPSALNIRSGWYMIYFNERIGAGRGRGYSRASEPPPRRKDELADAYAALGVASSASDADVRNAYRQAAKKYHPDALRAQGLPDRMIGKATEQMARVNDAWSRIKKARGL